VPTKLIKKTEENANTSVCLRTTRFESILHSFNMILLLVKVTLLS
jgi:hypothetical protein